MNYRFRHRTLGYTDNFDEQRREKQAVSPWPCVAARFSRLYARTQQRHHRPMFKLDFVVGFIIEVFRALLVDEFSERARKFASTYYQPRRLRGIKQVRQHVHSECRRRLFDRIST